MLCGCGVERLGDLLNGFALPCRVRVGFLGGVARLLRGIGVPPGERGSDDGQDGARGHDDVCC